MLRRALKELISFRATLPTRCDKGVKFKFLQIIYLAGNKLIEPPVRNHAARRYDRHIVREGVRKLLKGSVI